MAHYDARRSPGDAPRASPRLRLRCGLRHAAIARSIKTRARWGSFAHFSISSNMRSGSVDRSPSRSASKYSCASSRRCKYRSASDPYNERRSATFCTPGGGRRSFARSRRRHILVKSFASSGRSRCPHCRLPTFGHTHLNDDPRAWRMSDLVSADASNETTFVFSITRGDGVVTRVPSRRGDGDVTRRFEGLLSETGDERRRFERRRVVVVVIVEEGGRGGVDVCRRRCGENGVALGVISGPTDR